MSDLFEIVTLEDLATVRRQCRGHFINCPQTEDEFERFLYRNQIDRLIHTAELYIQLRAEAKAGK